MSETPLVSVVVPTRGRPERLTALLSCLRQQTLDLGASETIVVVDGGDAATHEILEAERRRGGLRMSVIQHPFPLGPGAARNRGWQAARAPLVAFIDDDCVPAPGWLAAGVQAAAHAALIQGRTLPEPAGTATQGLLTRTVTVAEAGPRFETCNIFYDRELLERLGGFDERFGTTPGGEDTDLGWRALGAGARSTFAPEALVYHAVEHIGVIGQLRVASRWTETIRIFAVHPRARQILYRHFFWNVWHYLMWRSALALLAPAWLRRMLLARHLLELRRRGRNAGAGSWGVPFLIVHDAIECWAVARGAIRHRTLVL